jgi:hypothetical protein
MSPALDNMKVVTELMAGLCILTEGQVYLKCSQCTTVSNIIQCDFTFKATKATKIKFISAVYNSIRYCFGTGKLFK